MAKSELGTKRVDPETGRKFYDLNKDPIVSPYTGIAYPRSAFEAVTAKARPSTARQTAAPEEDEAEEEADVETVTLEEADEEAGETGVVKADGIDEDDDLDDEADEDDTFLPDEDEDDDAIDDLDVDVDEEE